VSTYHSIEKEDKPTRRARKYITYKVTSDVCEYMVAHPDDTLRQVSKHFGLGDSTLYNWFSRRDDSKRTENLARWLGTGNNFQRLNNAREDLQLFAPSITGLPITGHGHTLEKPSKQEFTATWEAPSESLSMLREEARTVATQAMTIGIDAEALIAAIDLVQQWSTDRDKLDQANKLVMSLQDKIDKLESEKAGVTERLVKAQSTHSQP
jgi:hypothetical protein